MRKVKKLIIQFRQVLHMIDGNLITCNYDVSTKSVEHKGIDWHCVIWYKTDPKGDLVEGKTSYLSWSEVETRWAFHEGFNSDLLALRKSMKKKHKKVSKKSKK